MDGLHTNLHPHKDLEFLMQILEFECCQRNCGQKLNAGIGEIHLLASV